MTEKFPEYHALKNHLPNGVVLDGEIIPYRVMPPPGKVWKGSASFRIIANKDRQEKYYKKTIDRKRRSLFLPMICWNTKGMI